MFRMRRAALINNPPAALRAALRSITPEHARAYFRDSGHMQVFDAATRQHERVRQLTLLMLLM